MPTLSPVNRPRRLGLQRRIMLYVTVGLTAIFGVVGFVGLGAIEQATQLVYKERLAIAHTSAGILERDLARVANDLRVATADIVAAGRGLASQSAAAELLDRLARPDGYTFFVIRGVWLVDRGGSVIGEAGDPRVPLGTAAPVDRTLLVDPAGTFAVGRPAGPVEGAVPLATIAVRLQGAGSRLGQVAIAHAVSLNSRLPYLPAAHRLESPGDLETIAEPTQRYQLEVIDPDGITLLGLGPDTTPGTRSVHFAAIAPLSPERRAAALQHVPGPEESFEAHVLAVVPLERSPLFLVLEQPVDVALGLPRQLRDRLVLLTGLGFVGALVVAWVTTRHVVKPAEELRAAAERMARGDLRSPIAVAAQDEIGSLAESLDVMRQRLKTATEEAERITRELEQRVADRTARLGQVLQMTISAQEEERHRLARELHDETAQTLAALSIALDRARDALGGATSPGFTHIQEAKEIAARLLAETRRLILGLRPAVLDDLGLVPAIRWYCETSLTEGGVDYSVEVRNLSDRLPGPIEVALFRIVQEAVTNIAKHAQASRARIRLTLRGQTLTVVVADDGRGFDVDRVVSGDGTGRSVGLLGMQERVALLSGRVRIQSAEGRGTAIGVRLPVLREVE